MRKFIFISIWLISLIIASIGTYENPEMIDFLKENYNLQKYLPSKIKIEKGPSKKSIGNSFAVELSQEIYFPERTAFVIHDENVLNFNQNSLKIYFQNGYLLKKGKLEKLNLPNTFTKKRNGGVKTIFISSQHYANIISLIALKSYKNIKIVLVDRIDIIELKRYYNLSNFLKNLIIYFLVSIFYKKADAIITNSKSAKIDLQKLCKKKIININ